MDKGSARKEINRRSRGSGGLRKGEEKDRS